MRFVAVIWFAKFCVNFFTNVFRTVQPFQQLFKPDSESASGRVGTESLVCQTTTRRIVEIRWNGNESNHGRNSLVAVVSTDGHNRVMPNFSSDEPSAPDVASAKPVELAEQREKPGVAVAVVARRLGVAPATLRTWDRRYGLGPSERSAGSHRRYTRDDVLRLMVMRRLTLEGIAPGDAARAALEADLDVERALRASAVNEAQAAAKAAEDSQTPGAPTSLVHFTRPTLVQSNVVATPSDAVDAALRHDIDAATSMLALDPDADIVDWWTDLVDPAFTRLSERTVLAKPGEESVQVLTGAAMRAIREHQSAREAVSGTPHPSQMRRIVLIFTAPDEPHPLPAHTLAAALGAKGIMARIVSGPANPHRSQELVSMVRPAAIVLMTGLSAPVLDVVQALHESHTELPIFVGTTADAAADGLPLSMQVQRVRTFTGLFHEVLAVVSRGK